MFMTTASPVGSMAHACKSLRLPYGQGMTEVYAEQERIVLTKFRDFLNRVITMGEINETKCSSARSELESQKDPNINCTGNSSTETTHQQGATDNGVVKAMSNTVTATSSIHENRETKPKVEK